MSETFQRPDPKGAATVHACGPGSASCECRCDPITGLNCGHAWDGPVVERNTPGGGGLASITCSRCGMLAADHDLWVAP